MKANEAPEKIFLSRNALGVLCNSWWLEPDKSLDNVEYVRKDAFIEKANEFISTFFHPDDTELIDAVLNRFHEHMKFK